MVSQTQHSKSETGAAIIALTHNGARMGRSLANRLAEPGDHAPTLLLERRYYQAGEAALPFDLPVRPVVQRAFRDHPSLVLFLPAGAAVRLLAPCLDSKYDDPAVVCVDDAGRFCVSLLSGHLGGADELAVKVADCLGATAVITSASHASGTLAVDLLGRKFGWRIEAGPLAVTRASAAVVDHRPVGVYQDTGETGWWTEGDSLPDNITPYPTLEALDAARCDASLLITDRTVAESAPARSEATVFYRPPSLIAGMGCRRGVAVEELDALLTETFAQEALSLGSLGCIATAELKRDEVGLQQLAERYGVPLVDFSSSELNAVYAEPLTGTGEIRPVPSPRAHSLVGVWGVAEPAALLASGAAGLLVPRRHTDRATIAVARRPYPGATS